MSARGNLERLGRAVLLGLLIKAGADLLPPPVTASNSLERPGAIVYHLPDAHGLQQAPIVPLTQVGVIYTNDVNFPPGSPDPSAIRKVPQGISLIFADTPRPGGEFTIPPGSLIFADPESEEVDPSLFQQWLPYGNTFATTSSGSWIASFDTRFTPSDGSVLIPPPTAQLISNEITGFDFGPGRIFYTDDQSQRYGEWEVGPDGQLNTVDDVITEKRFASLPGFTSIDAEDLVVAENGQSLLVAGGDTGKVVEVYIGPNGVGGGDDAIVDEYSTATADVKQKDPEGIATCYYPFGEETTVVISNARNPDEPFATEFTRINGVTRVKRYFDFSAATPAVARAGGLDCDVALDGAGNQTVTLRVADRGSVDTNPDDTVVVYDGRIYEFQYTEEVYPVFLPAVLK